MRNKNLDFEKIASKLDISPSMYKYAVDRYTGISNYLFSKGINATFYPQGSFRTGTVTRPLKNSVECDFDIDVICELTYNKKSINATQVKKIVGNALMEGETYRKKLLPEGDRCWTLSYADLTDTVGLKLDVVPAIKDDPSKVIQLISNSVPTDYAKLAIAITERKNRDYDWLPSNPSGFGLWFDNINKKYTVIDNLKKKEQFFYEHRDLFAADAKIEDVPDYYIKSSLQRVIQLLKRHRAIYFYRYNPDYKPSSIIITSLTAKIANITPPQSTENLLLTVVNNLCTYKCLIDMKVPMNKFGVASSDFIQRRKAEWWIPNPVDPEDNYADYWTDEHAKAFFKWIEVVKHDLGDSNTGNETRYITGLQTSFGKDWIASNLELNIPSKSCISPSPLKKAVKPWGDND